MSKLASLCFVFLLLFSSAKTVNAQADKFITVVNPVRIAPYSKNVIENIAAEYKIANDLEIPATWLLTYDILENDAAIKKILGFNDNQEIGLFLEVDNALTRDASVEMHKGSWQHSNVVFLSGYTQNERVRMVDTLFDKFEEKFGYYPKSVGSWWTDSYSLAYMHDKYGVSANLTVADQFSTDRYQVWGQYWGVPFYPSKYHSGIPASSKGTKLPVVMLQWAPRDPVNGYYSSLYSTQDYYIAPIAQDVEYFRRLISIYLNDIGDYGQVTIGLEGDLTPDAYSVNYEKQLNVAKGFVDNGLANFSTMSGFASWYLSKYVDLSPTHLIHEKDLLGTNKEVVWFQNPMYRAGIMSDPDENRVKIFDFRMYNDNFVEPYYEWPNREFDLSINIPSIYDGISDPNNLTTIDDSFSEVQQDGEEATIILTSGRKINLYRDKLEVIETNGKVVQSIKPENISPYYFRDLKEEAGHLLLSKKLIVGILLSLGLFIYLLYRYRKSRMLPVSVFSGLLVITATYFIGTQIYLVGQSEVDVLRKLKKKPGRVLVYDSECLQCEWYGDNKPAALANKRSYIEKLTGSKVVYDSAFFKEADLESAKGIFNNLSVDYIYLVTYGSYMESLPLSPGDINIEKVYSNANAQLWRVKND